MPRLRTRAERFGAMIALDEPAALVAVDRAMARRLGVDGGALWTGDDPGLDVGALEAPNEVHVAVTDRCPMGCKGCYADARAEGHEPTFAELAARLRALAERGVFRVAFGGGEPMLRGDLCELGRAARELGLEPSVTTSGLGLTAARALACRDVFAQINVSYDGAGATYEAVRGVRAADRAEAAMRALHAAGCAFGVNVVLTRASFDELAPTAARAHDLGAREIQLLRYKPAGRATLHYRSERLTDAQIARFPRALEDLARTSPLAVRIDCALVPFLTGAPGTALDPALLRRFGVLGCEAGRSLLAAKADGASAPCSFWTSRGAPIDGDAWARDPTLARFRAHAADPPEPCASCTFHSTCRGGCRIVALHLTGDAYAPDPECPRVRAFLHEQGQHPP